MLEVNDFCFDPVVELPLEFQTTKRQSRLLWAKWRI